MSLFTVEVNRQGPLELLLEPSYPVGYIGSLYLLVNRGWPLPPPLLQACLLQSSFVTACLRTWHRYASARRGVRFVFLDLSEPLSARTQVAAGSCGGPRGGHVGQVAWRRSRRSRADGGGGGVAAIAWRTVAAEGGCGGDEKHRGGRAGPPAAVRREEEAATSHATRVRRRIYHRRQRALRRPR